MYSKETEVIVDEEPVTPVILTENYELDGCQEEDPVVLSVESVENDVTYQWLRNGVAINGAVGDTYMG